MPQPQPTVAIGASFLKSMTALPDKVMKKTRETISKLQRDPGAPGLNYERIEGARDERLRSIRIDQTYRCIVLHADKSNAYILLWVAHHDEAYAWAADRQCSVNPHTGSIQVLEVEENPSQPGPRIVAPEQPLAPMHDDRPDLFVSFSNRDLEQLGATDEMLPLIRSIKDEDTLDKMQRRFPSQVYEALYMLACGENFDDVTEELGIDTSKEYDPEDFDTALDLDTNKQHFAAITDDAELEAILNEPLALWRVYLHPSQRRLVERAFNGPARVLGGAGTGKTVVAMHRAQFLASQCEAKERILFTTFTKSLISDIKYNLQKICSYDEIRKIEVLHLDSWVVNFLKGRGYNHQIVYGSALKSDSPTHRLWNRALEEVGPGDFSSQFLYDEWYRVVQYHDVKSFIDYARIPRVGRRGRLSRLQRKSIWPVFQEYRTLLEENQFWEQPDMMRAARSLLETEDTGAGFKHIIVDEIQDFHPQAFRLLRAMIPANQFKQNDLFLVGDGHQNLYGHHIVLSRLGINIRGRSQHLRLNYRTPEETRRWATAILKGVEVSDLDGATDTDRGYRSILSGPDPRFEPCQGFDKEVAIIAGWIREIKKDTQSHVICVALRRNTDRAQYAEALRKHDLAVHEITSESPDCEEPAPVRVATMHRIKGLEFDHVCLAGLGRDPLADYTGERLDMEKCLVHVAATRTKNSLLVLAGKEQFADGADIA